MNPLNDKRLLTEAGIKEKLEGLKFRVSHLNNDLPCLKECAHLPEMLQKLYELREGLNQLEHGILQSHLKCCISPCINISAEVALAASKLSAKRHGAIIVIEQENKLDGYLSGGAMVDALVSVPMLETIFYPGNPLHDGAVVIQKNRIQNAGCFLPLASQAIELGPLGLGTRHQAALGLSQLCDALVIVISEEKGWISIALQGQLYPNLGTFALLQKLDKKSEKEKLTTS